MVAVRSRSDWHTRIVAALSTVPSISRVVSVGRRVPASWGPHVVTQDNAYGAEVVVDPEPEDQGIPVFLGDGHAGILHATPEGLARSLETRVPESAVVWTVVGDPVTSGVRRVLPSPIGVVFAVDGQAKVPGPLAGLGAIGATATLAVVDDDRYLRAACAAAGALIARPDPTAATPVWERAEEFIAACESLGVVVAAAGG